MIFLNHLNIFNVFIYFTRHRDHSAAKSATKTIFHHPLRSRRRGLRGKKTFTFLLIEDSRYAEDARKVKTFCHNYDAFKKKPFQVL